MYASLIPMKNREQSDNRKMKPEEIRKKKLTRNDQRRKVREEKRSMLT